MEKVLKKVLLFIAGALQGTFGSYWFLIGLMGATPEMTDYEESLSMVPYAYAMLLIWVGVMLTAIILLRKNKYNLLSFFIAWGIGVVGLILWL